MGDEYDFESLEEDGDEMEMFIEDHVYFNEEDCTCDHGASEHGWGECDVEGCDCSAGWEE